MAVIGSAPALMAGFRTRNGWIKVVAPETATFERKTDAKNWATKFEGDMKAGRHFGQINRHQRKVL